VSEPRANLEDVESAPSGSDGSANPWIIRAGQIGVGIALVGLWQFASGRLVDPFFISAPTDVIAKLVKWAGDGTLALHAGYTQEAAFFLQTHL